MPRQAAPCRTVPGQSTPCPAMRNASSRFSNVLQGIRAASGRKASLSAVAGFPDSCGDPSGPCGSPGALWGAPARLRHPLRRNIRPPIITNRRESRQARIHIRRLRARMRSSALTAKALFSWQSGVSQATLAGGVSREPRPSPQLRGSGTGKRTMFRFRGKRPVSVLAVLGVIRGARSGLVLVTKRCDRAAWCGSQDSGPERRTGPLIHIEK